MHTLSVNQFQCAFRQALSTAVPFDQKRLQDICLAVMKISGLDSTSVYLANKDSLFDYRCAIDIIPRFLRVVIEPDGFRLVGLDLLAPGDVEVWEGTVAAVLGIGLLASSPGAVWHWEFSAHLQHSANEAEPPPWTQIPSLNGQFEAVGIRFREQDGQQQRLYRVERSDVIPGHVFLHVAIQSDVPSLSEERPASVESFVSGLERIGVRVDFGRSKQVDP